LWVQHFRKSIQNSCRLLGVTLFDPESANFEATLTTGTPSQEITVSLSQTIAGISIVE
jgi:hypothetical protein